MRLQAPHWPPVQCIHSCLPRRTLVVGVARKMHVVLARARVPTDYSSTLFPYTYVCTDLNQCHASERYTLDHYRLKTADPMRSTAKYQTVLAGPPSCLAKTGSHRTSCQHPLRSRGTASIKSNGSVVFATGFCSSR